MTDQLNAIACAYVAAIDALKAHKGPTEGPIYDAKLEGLRKAALALDAECHAIAHAADRVPA